MGNLIGRGEVVSYTKNAVIARIGHRVCPGEGNNEGEEERPWNTQTEKN